MADKCKSKGISLATTKKHLSLREKADEHYKRNALRVQLKYSKKKRIMVRIFSPGDYVSLAVETDGERKARLKKMATTQLRLAPETEEKEELDWNICQITQSIYT